MNEETTKGLGPQITQMDADEEYSSSASALICVNLRAIPDSVAAGCDALFCVPSRLKIRNPQREVGLRPIRN
jgi:hypothetical protein